MTKRIFSALLVALLLLSSVALVACQDGEEQSSQIEIVSGTGEQFLNETKNWGETIKILTYGNQLFSTCEIAPEELIDEPVNDAFFERNAIIEQNYGITIEVETIDDHKEAVDTIRRNCQSSLDEYQACCIPLTYISALGVEGLLYDYGSLPNNYIHLDQAWWDQTVIKDISINGKIWFLAGDALVEDDQNTYAIYFNKDLIKSHDLENPYELVNNKQWTLDKMHEMATKVHSMNGTTKSYDPEVGDRWGIVAQSYNFYNFMLGGGQRMVDNTGDVPVMRIDDEENVSTFMAVCEIMYDEQNCGVADFFGSWDSGVYGQQSQIFYNGNALFFPSTISSVSSEGMRDAEIHYGILPMPLRSELQEEYTTSVNVYWCPVLSIPISNVELLDATCYALEAMAYYGKELVTPEYYDRTLTYKRFEDEESGEMLDLIFRNRTYDLGAIFDFNGASSGSGMLYFYTTLLGQRADNLMSLYESKESAYQAGIDQLIDRCYND